MAFVTYWLEKDALKALSGILSDGKGTILEVSLPKKKPQAPKATTWEGGYEELKLYVTGISTLTSKSEVLGEFMQDGDCEVHMMQNTAFVNYTTKKNAARAIKRLHNKLTFPGSSRSISVRYARKKNTTPPAQKTTKPKAFEGNMVILFTTFSYNSSCFFYCTQATPAHTQLRKKSYNATSAKNQRNQKPSKVTWSLY